MDKKRFETLVEEAIKSLPEESIKLLKNITIIVEDFPSQEILDVVGATRNTLLGLYHGVPFKHRGPYYGNLPPDVISIYQKPIEQICSTEKEIQAKVREVVLHEVGHYFGLSENRLRENETYSNRNEDINGS
jgi:predicted Zn-dependent protease with MMP-like domain